ncbi:AMP-binding protein [Mycolicibacterium elephantis]|uniref:Acyl-CoA synthetase n=1 Tax=Mycolicibacterium elephantis DSM 44368 TaxID=1335622 RepID=A0A439DMV3_9MYCO|nr:AMP-binding protein [Mycolicibacterium elephantis]MCV7220321.1 AMP-binding protein [Mycolicibacterium elephantis]RWA16397.1 acyl-CoA synthetase [Mycolicibacterium elephantis DSM 44368]
MYPGRHVHEHPDRPALIMAGSRKSLTYRELDDRANRVANHFRALGLGRTDHIAIFTENHLDMIVTMSAAERCGLYYTPVNSFLSVEEAAYIVDDCGAQLVVTSAAKFEVAQQLPRHCPKVRHWLVLDLEDPPAPFDNFEAVIAPYPPTPGENERLGTPMFYSSGTTGRPKAVKRQLPDVPPSHQLGIEEMGRRLFRMREGMTFLSTAPLYHSGPQSSISIGLRLGATHIVMEKFDTEQFLSLIEEFRVTHTMVVPTMFSRALKLPKEIRDRYDYSSLEAVVHGAAPCPRQVKQDMLDWWGPVIYEYYGGTEANGTCGCTPQEWLANPGTVGKAFFGEIVIRDDDGNELPPGVPGTVWFRGGNSSFEYLNDPEKTAQAMDPSGTMSKIGDIGYVNEEGYLFLTDRQAFVIISGGVNIYPQEIENLLITHPEVMDAAVFGVPDDDFGEAVKAVIQPVDPDGGTPELAQRLREFCLAHLARFKCPKTFDFIDEMPRLPTGKLYKRQLRDQYWQDHKEKTSA